MSERRIHFSGRAWEEIEALPQPLRWSVQRTLFHLLDEPVPSLAEPFPSVDPLPGAYELHLPADEVTVWYVLAKDESGEVVSVQYVLADA